MSRERELIKDMKILLECTDMGGLQRNADVLIGRAIELLAQPEQEGVYQKLLRIEDGIEVEILPSELWQDGYETGKRSVLLSKQPEQEPVAWMYDHQIEVGYDKYTEVNIIETCARNLESNNCINIRPLYLAPPKQEPLSDEAVKGFVDLVRMIEKARDITGVEDE